MSTPWKSSAVARGELNDPGESSSSPLSDNPCMSAVCVFCAYDKKAKRKKNRNCLHPRQFFYE